MSAPWFSGVSLTFQVGWASNPSVAIGSTSWTDESFRVRAVSTRIGRNSEINSFDVGTMTVTLDNHDRRFDPNYAAGPLFGNLLPMRRARFYATYSAVDYPIWSGFLTDLPQQYDIGQKDATVSIQCADAFKVLSLLKLPESVYAVQIPLDTPAGWWRLGETSGTTAIDASGFGHHGVYVGGATFNSTSGLVYGGTDAAIAFDGVDDYIEVGNAAITAYPFTIEAWVVTSGSDFLYVYNQSSFDGRDRLVFSCSAAGITMTLFAGNGLAVYTTTYTGAALADGLSHHIAAVVTDGNSDAVIYIDGVAQTVGHTILASPVSPATVPGRSFIGAFLGVSAPDPTLGHGTLDEVAVYSTALSAATIAAHYGFGSTPWAGDLTGARIGRMLDLAAWPAADRDIATGVSTMQSLVLSTSPVLPSLQTVEQSEQGQLFIGPDGKVVFRDRHWRFENSLAITSNATFGDSGSELRYSDIVTDGGEQFIFNRIRASRDGGALISVSDATSITTFYERSDEVNGLQNQSDLEVIDLANWRLSTHKNPIQRVTVLELKPRKFDQASTLFPQVLGRGIGDRVTVKRRPQALGAALTYTLLIEGIEHAVDARGSWVTRWYLSAADSQATVQPLVLDSATFGLLDTNVLAY